MNVNVVLPVRKGSERVPNKNFKEFYNGKNLLEIKLEQIIEIGLFDKIYIDSDSEIAEEIALNYGVNFVERDPYFASSKVSNSEYWQNLGDRYEGLIFMINVTNPLVYSKSIFNFYNNFKLGNFTSGLSVTLVKEYLFHNNKPLNFSLDEVCVTQKLPDFYSPNFALNITSTEYLSKNRSFFSNNCYHHTLNKIEGLDIDDNSDFILAQNLYAAYRSE